MCRCGRDVAETKTWFTDSAPSIHLDGGKRCGVPYGEGQTAWLAGMVENQGFRSEKSTREKASEPQSLSGCLHRVCQ